MQIIVPVSINTFINALGVNRRVSDNVRDGTSTADEVMLQVAQAYLSERNLTLTRAENKAKLEEFYSKHCHVRLCFEGNVAVGGFVVLQGELLALHNIEPGHGDWMLKDAIGLGAHKLSCWGIPPLLSLYKRHGFYVTHITAHQHGPEYVGIANMLLSGN